MASSLFSLTVDYAFKKFFVDHPDLLVDFLNAVFLEFDQLTIHSLKILNPELPGEAINDKNAILDILAEDEGGHSFNIEMQAYGVDQFAKRSAFYAFRLYNASIKKGKKHAEIPPVYSVNLLDFDLFPGLSYHRCFRLLDVKEPSVAMMDGIEFHFIELKKLHKAIDEMKDPLEEWSAFIRFSGSLTEEDMSKLKEKNPVFKKAHSALKAISRDSKAKIEYDRRQATIYFYERTLEKRYAEGIAEGEQKGKAEGIAEGKAEGEHQRNLEIAKQMKEEKLSTDLIQRVTGLTAEEVERL
jgi:predicted transposase/invertase (TIGR01784 family)